MAETLLDYVTSLQNQGIDGNSKPSIYELVEKWKKENTDTNTDDNQPEEVEETEVVVDENVDATETPNPNNPFAERAQQYEDAENQQKAYEEYKQRIESVAKPNETYAGFEGGEEYKYDIKPGENPLYYKREKGSDNEWTLIDFEDDQYFDVGARVFKHFDFDEDAFQATQNILSKGGSDQVFDSFKETVGDLDMNQKSLEGFENIDKIYQENVDVTDDQQTSIDTQNDFFINNGKRDLSVDIGMFENKADFLIEEKAVPQLQAKFEGTGIKFEEAGLGDFAKVTLPNGDSKRFELRKGKEAYEAMNEFIGQAQEDYKELENKAISEIASEQGLEPGVNFNVDENQEAIQDRVRKLHNDKLVSAQRVENLTQYIQGLGTDFEGEEAGKYLRETFDFSTAGILKSTMGIAGDILGIDTGQTKITDVFDKTDIQKQIQEYEEIKNSNLTEKGKNVETFLKNGQGLLEDLYATANLLANADYQTPTQATEGRKQLANVNKQIEGIQGLLEEKYNEFNEELKENPDGALFLDKLKRNYGVAPILINNMKASTLEMGLGVEELAYQAYDLFSSTDSPNVEGVVQAVAQVTPFEEHRKKAIELTDKYIEEGLRGTVAEAKSIEDVSSFGDFITWGSATTGSLIPQVTAMTMAPYTGLALVTASAGGSKFREYQKEMDASQKAYDDFIAAGGDPADAPEVVNYSKVQMWGGAMLNMGLEFGMGRLISLPLASGKSVMSPILGRFGALSSNPAIQSGWVKNFSNVIKSGAVHVGDATLEGFEEGFIGIGDQWYNRYVLGKDVDLMDGFYDQFAAGFVGGGYFKAPGIIQSYLSPVQTPGDVSNITGLQNEIKSINNAIIQNPKMSQKTREVLENNVAEKVIDINNSINNSLNIYTELSEADFKELGSLDQQLYNINSQLEAVQEDAGIEVGKEQLIEDLTNKRNELTGQKNRLIEGYVKTDAEGKVTGGRIVAPIIKAGSQVVADQLGVGIQTFDNTQDFIGSMETLKSEGVQVELAQDADGNILPAEEQGYGLIATLPDGTKQVIINEASQQADGVIPADKHEVLHAFVSKMDPEVKSKMGEDLYNLITNDTGDITSRVEIDPRTKASLDTYKEQLNNGEISQDIFHEEVMAVVSDGLTQGTVKIKETGPVMNLVNKFLETIGFKQSFEDGKQVVDFLKDFNRDVLGGQGLSQQTLDRAGVNLDTQDQQQDTTVRKSELPEATQAYMDLDNSMLQQGLNEALQNKTDQQFPLAQAIVEKNWPLISKSLNINNEAEMNAAKEVVIDQVLGQFEGSGQGKYGPRNTSALAGFSLEGGAQVSTYLAETIRTRKPEIDAAIVDRTAGPGIQVDQVGDVVTQTETTEVAESRPLPSETTTYSDAILETVKTDKAGLETRITEAVQESYPGRTDVRLAETRNIPQKVAEVYTEMLGITNPNRLTDKSQTFSVTDEAGLRNAQMFLTQNAQADFANLPEALDADGRGTFIPLNIKKALYTDGKKTGTLKDYLNLIKIPQTKKIYRDSAKVGTIRGLLNTHIRNRILETGNPDAASRIAGGAKFSKRPQVESKRKDTRTPNQVLADMGRGPMRIQTLPDGSLVVDSDPVQPLSKDGKTLPKPRRSVKPAKIFKKAINNKDAIDGVTDVINNIDPEFNKLSQKDKIKAYNKMFKDLAGLDVLLSDLLSSRNLNASGQKYSSIKKRQGVSGMQYIPDVASIQQNIKTLKSYLPLLKFNPQTGRKEYKKGKKIYTKESIDNKVKELQKSIKAYNDGEFGSKSDLINQIENNRKTANKDITRAVKSQPSSRPGRKVVDKTIKNNIKDINQIRRGFKKFLDAARKLPKRSKAAFIRMFHGDSQHNNNLGRQLGKIIGDMGIFPPGLVITNEHVLQLGVYTRLMGATLTAPDAQYKTIRDWLAKNTFQVALADPKNLDGSKRDNQETNFKEDTHDLKGIFDPTETLKPWNAKSEMEPFLKAKIEGFLNGDVTKAELDKISSLTRYFNEYFYRNPNNLRIYNPKTKKVEPVSKVYDTQVPRQTYIGLKGERLSARDLEAVNPKTGLAVYPNVEKAQAYATMLRLRGEWTAKKAQDYLKTEIPIALALDKANIRSADYIPFIETQTVDGTKRATQTTPQIKKSLLNSLKTRVNAQKVDKPTKGISVFDFDDTLALTKEKVIVNMPDGSIKEITASQFAQDADQLTADGATFDFSNFDKVAKGTAEGPLADLARKRQGKFGSGDIFVLTARPQASAQAIHTFLKGIGINIPLKNITGLSDGSPQAKVDFILNKTAEGYNDFYFADDSLANVKAVKEVLDAVDVKNSVQQAIADKPKRLKKEINQIIEEVTGVESFKEYSTVRARLEGKKKDGGIFKRIGRQFTITYSAEDFAGLTYALRGKGEQGNRHAKFIQDNLIDPYNKAELALLTAKVNVGRDFAALRKKFPTLRGSRFSLSNPLLAEIDGGPFNKEQAIRVYLWNKQGMEIPDMAKRDVNRLVKAVEADTELQSFADQLYEIQRGPEYPPPGKNWLGGSIKSDILNSMDKSFRSELMTEFNENVDAIFNPQTLNKLEAIYGTKYREALEDSIRRMKSGSNRPLITGSGSGLVNEMLDWLNGSVANVMFLNSRSGLLQTLSTVNFINWGDNNIYAASKAFASKEMWPTFMRLMNSDYLVNRRDGLRINVNEAELADAAKKGGIKGAFSYLLDKGFAITRIMDSFAIALGGSTFFINRKKALLNRINPETGKLYTEAEADAKAFLDFYDIAEETQQSSNPSKISSQQASIAGRLLLSFQNITMQMNRKTKKSILDLYNRRKKPGLTQRESDLSNMSSIVYYVGMQNLIFNSLQQGLFALMFEDDEEEDLDLKKEQKIANTVNGMVDSLLFGLGFGGAIVATSKNIIRRIAEESDKNKPDYRDIPDDVFDVSSVIDAKFRKLQSAARTFTFERDEIKRRGWSLDNPAYLAVAQIIAAGTNLPIDRVLMKVNNLRQASDESVRTWQRVALVLGWSGWQFGLPYWGRQSTEDREAKEDEKIKENYAKQVKEVKAKGFTKKIPLSGPNHYKPKGELGVDFMQVERPDGTIQYYVKHKK